MMAAMTCASTMSSTLVNLPMPLTTVSRLLSFTRGGLMA
jgi:hypothetical protein